jgi:hypothetical protein
MAPSNTPFGLFAPRTLARGAGRWDRPRLKKLSIEGRRATQQPQPPTLRPLHNVVLDGVEVERGCPRTPAPRPHLRAIAPSLPNWVRSQQMRRSRHSGFRVVPQNVRENYVPRARAVATVSQTSQCPKELSLFRSCRGQCWREGEDAGDHEDGKRQLPEERDGETLRLSCR